MTEARMNVFEFLMMHLIWGDQYIDGPMDPKIGGTGPQSPHGGCAYDCGDNNNNNNNTTNKIITFTSLIRMKMDENERRELFLFSDTI